MFQTFDTPSDRTQGPLRLAQLRDVLTRRGAGRLFGATRRRPSGRVRRSKGCKTGVVDRLYRLGRILRRAYGLRRRVCRRPLPGAGQTTGGLLF